MNKRNALAHYQAMETQARLAQALREVMVESGVCNWDSAGRPWLQRARNTLFNFELRHSQPLSDEVDGNGQPLRDDRMGAGAGW